MSTLRERKRLRAREAIVEAAHQLFAERGFDQVTVTDIAERAEVGRSTFFRYFGDKQEVVFAADDGVQQAAAQAGEGGLDGPIGDSLPAALGFVRAVVVSYVGSITTDPAAYTRHEELVAKHPELMARSVVKQRRYAELLAGLLVEQGASEGIAVLAAELGLACFYAGRAMVDDDPRRLTGAVDAAFDRLSAPGPPRRKAGRGR
jgi:AcrR family transcriptional regulator